ncbi:chemotaxis protein CheB [Candidatus Magnetaquicoccus inordinatus]|uniref:chemotaxis protein CheB n=1 Tax=Candidatus Magnetaquicoccus inordinatus TaxID=2496818 RepID=UPI00187D6D8D|nr:chemotaxis protein CheB [Candidatus Magnetaquicoccus inordinatus]
MRESEPNPIRVLLVDASALTLALLKRALSLVSVIQVVGSVRGTQEAMELIAESDPHVVCVGLQLQDVEGAVFVRALMERYPRSVLVVGAASLRDGDATNIFRMFEAGALDLFLEPLGWRSEDVGSFSRELTSKIRLLARLDTLPDFSCDSTVSTLPMVALPAVNMVVMGVGIGGISALREILAALPVDFAVPILCVVHVHPVLQTALPRWLGEVTRMPVQMATHGEMPMPGSIYLAPVGHHLLIDAHGRLATLAISSGVLPAHYGHHGELPSILVAMESVANRLGAMTIGVLLSGTGEDGARGLEAIYQAGGYTVAMDESSALVFDLPARLLELGAVRNLLPCSVIARSLQTLLGGTEGERPCGQVAELSVGAATLLADSQSGGGSVALTSGEWRAGEGILIVEDSPTQAYKLKRFLLESGFMVRVAKDGLEGLQQAEQLLPRLIISDVSMPRMDGFTLCRQIKQDGRLHSIPVMLLTALTNPEEILEGLSAGADNYLTKPWEGTQLLAAVQRVLQASDALEQTEGGIEISFADKSYTITSSRRQVLDLLLVTYQRAVKQNRELMDNHLELKMLNSRLVDQAARLEMINQNLQAEVNERRRIEAAQALTMRELEVANRELNDFAYIISHDLKAPFRAIGSLTSWLSADFADRLGEEGMELVKLLQGRADRLNGLIDALMEYVRVTRLHEELQDVDLNRLVNRVIKELQPPEEMEISIDDSLPSIRFEPRRAEQIFHSLLENAIRFMDKRLGIIRIACVGEAATAEGVGAGAQLPGSGGWWHFSVRDNGPGIDESHFEKIFAVFQTLQARDHQESSGMGLALVRKIVGKFAGRVWVESKVGEGSVFHFTLPKEP